MGKKLQVGVIGLGHQSLEDHLPAIRASTDVELGGVVETDKRKLRSFLKENKDVDGYDSFDELLRNKELDFVIIAVPHYLHYEIVKKAVLKSLHILKEKPLAVSLEQAREIKAISDRSEVEIAVTLQRRFNPIYSTFFQLIDKIGTVFLLMRGTRFIPNHLTRDGAGIKI